MTSEPIRMGGGERGRLIPTVRGSDLVLMIEVARRYYLHERSKVEIAKEFDLSRFQVARLLDTARTNGLVRIDIRYPAPFAVELAKHLRDTFGLRRVVVADSPLPDPAGVRHCVGRAAAEMLSDIISPADVLGLGEARAVNVMAKNLAKLPPIPVVQLTGAMIGPRAGDSSINIVHEVARRCGSPAYFFRAPLVVPSSATARVLRGRPEVARAFEKFASVTKAVVGIGLWRKSYSSLHDRLGTWDREEMRERGACGDLSGVFIGADGRIVNGGITDRVIRIGPDELRAVPDVIGVAYQSERAPAVRAAVRSGLVNNLVLDTRLAEALLRVR